jgi:hypothetical protein
MLHSHILACMINVTRCRDLLCWILWTGLCSMMFYDFLTSHDSLTHDFSLALLLVEVTSADLIRALLVRLPTACKIAFHCSPDKTRHSNRTALPYHCTSNARVSIIRLSCIAQPCIPRLPCPVNPHRIPEAVP